jgi:LysM repeat protein
MALKRILPFFVIILIATGCFRQASDTFDTVDSGGGDAATQVLIPPTETEDAAVTVISVGMDDLTPTEEPTATEDTAAILGVDTDVPTEIAVQATATDLPAPTEDSSSSVLPTATTVSFITPEPVVAVENPTAAPSPTRNPALQPTPSDEETAVEVEPPGECEYVVQAGDNAFRIALNNNVVLEDLLAVNELPENPIIQPGQVLIIPDCEEGEDTDAMVESTEAVESTQEAVELEDGFRLHTVATGETLLTIARQYGVTVNDILNENTNVTDPNRITPGQELLIPPAEE